MSNSDDDRVLTLEDFARFSQRKPIKKREDYFKPVVEYDMDGVPLREYSSCTEAGEVNGISASNVGAICLGRHKYSTKLMKIFLYRGDDIEKRMSLINQVNKLTKKPVFEYTLGGRLVYKYESTAQAATINKITSNKITNCCKGRTLYIGKSTFLYEDGDVKKRVSEIKSELYRLSKKRPKYLPVDVYTLKGKFIKGFPSASAASRELGIPVSNITRCCYGIDGKGYSKLTANSKIFLWFGESISERLKLIKEKKK